VKSRSQKSSVLPSGERKKRTVKSTPPQNFDQLALSAHKLLNDEHLEVSKIRPFFWSLVETYVDRFQVYPFDVSKALFGYLELEACSEDEVQALIGKLEQLCENKKIEMAGGVANIGLQPVLEPVPPQSGLTKHAATKTTAVTSGRPKSSVAQSVVSNLLSIDRASLDEDVEGLRACLKYASLVPEI